MTSQAFTVFSTIDGFQGNRSGEWQGLGLQAMIDHHVARFGGRYGELLAWAPEWPDFYDGGTKSRDQLVRESIAAGRVIKLIDGKYIPFGPGAPEYCDAQGEPIAPTFYCAAETLSGERFIGLDADHDALDEALRAPLDWSRATPFDPFKDFASSSDTATPDHAYSHPLTRVADAGAQILAQHGSAHILPKA